jgi:hypothetical protein
MLQKLIKVSNRPTQGTALGPKVIRPSLVSSPAEIPSKKIQPHRDRNRGEPGTPTTLAAQRSHLPLPWIHSKSRPPPAASGAGEEASGIAKSFPRRRGFLQQLRPQRRRPHRSSGGARTSLARPPPCRREATTRAYSTR